MKLEGLLSMQPIARTKDAIYFRLPNTLQEPIACECPFCKAHPDHTPAWDTLGVPLNFDPKKRTFQAHTWTWRIHMPDPAWSQRMFDEIDGVKR